jgi:DMSO reductase anchor subunit
MEEKHWPLVIMTLGCQMAVGLLFFHITFKHLLNIPPDLLVEGGSLFTAGLAAMISSLHLGCPGNAFNVIRNIKSSWFSREAVFMILFLGCLALQTTGRLMGVSLHLEIPALVAGLSLVYAMSKVYDLKAVPTWKGRAVMKDFFTTVFLLGGISYSLFSVFISGEKNFLFMFTGLFLLVRLYQSLMNKRMVFLSSTATLSWLISLILLMGSAARSIPLIFLLVCLVLMAVYEYRTRSIFYHSYQRSGV